jgi:predicted nuclease with TOPRIM domain
MSDLEATITNMIQGEVDSAVDEAICNSSQFAEVENNVENLQCEHDQLREEFDVLQSSHEELIARIENLLDMNPHLKEEA